MRTATIGALLGGLLTTSLLGSSTAVAQADGSSARERAELNVTEAATEGIRASKKRPKTPALRIVRPPRSVGTLSAANFGIHSYQGDPGLSSGSYRHNCYPLWRNMNPAPGEYNWTTADKIIDEGRAMGFTDALFSFCGTPAWAARLPVLNPAREYWGESSTAAPKDMGDWRTFVRAFIERYGTRIARYETWNEATAQFLWQGTPDEMGQMTKILYDAVQELDPTATVVSANSQMGEQPAWFRSFFPKYMKALAARDWPVDVVSIHTYAGHPSKIPPAEGVVKRAEVLDEFVAAAKKAGIPSRVQFWDTETNYLGKASPRLQQALVLRTYLDSWRHGLKRTYWYMWVREPYPWLGIQMMDGEPGVTAYNTMMEWTVGAKFVGCAQTEELYVCSFSRAGKTFDIAYSRTYEGREALPLATPKQVCEPTGAACVTKSKKVTVTYMPVKIG